MTWEAVSAISEATGAIVVIVSLIYVAIQIRQNTKAVTYQTTQALIHANSESAYLLSSDADLATLFHKGSMDRSLLTDVERLRFNTYLYGYYNQADFAYEQSLEGQVASTTWARIERDLPIWISLPGVRAWWDEDKTRLSDGFVAFLEKKVEEMEALENIPTLGIPGYRRAT
jgi:hypothetical protein